MVLAQLEFNMETDYTKYRGKCLSVAKAMVADNPTLSLVRGWYHCPIWGKQEHWWCKTADGTIIDPTVLQFPSKGMGNYEEFAGAYTCEYCGKDIKEEEVYPVDQHVYCSYTCYGHDVGF
jgi:hypothetical protein